MNEWGFTGEVKSWIDQIAKLNTNLLFAGAKLEEVGKGIDKSGKDFKDEKSLFNYITEEELWACTSCNACVQACPVNIDPLSIILDLRRFLVMEESKVPSELATMFSKIENNGAPWQFSQADRGNWTDSINGKS